jgi:hypothetical protein
MGRSMRFVAYHDFHCRVCGLYRRHEPALDLSLHGKHLCWWVMKSSYCPWFIRSARLSKPHVSARASPSCTSALGSPLYHPRLVCRSELYRYWAAS